jgi:hypothetical protein
MLVSTNGTGQLCANCNDHIGTDDLWYCSQCGQDVCSECTGHCAGCDEVSLPDLPEHLPQVQQRRLRRLPGTQCRGSHALLSGLSRVLLGTVGEHAGRSTAAGSYPPPPISR